MKFFIKTYGCQMNKYEEGIIKKLLINNNFVPSDNIDNTDVTIVLTCMVRQHAEDRALGFLNSKGKGVKVIAGCIAEARKENLKQYADIIIGPDKYRKLPSLIKQKRKKALIHVGTNGETYKDILPEIIPGVSTYLTVMRGCNNFCTYCIVPYVRGYERSKPFLSIIKEVENFVKKGGKHITLIGQNVLSYKDGNITFTDLIREVSKIDGIERIGFLTSHPKDVTDNFIKEIAENRKILKYFHLPLQSASNRILKLMNRKYDFNHYKNIIYKIRKMISDPIITTDIIVGFPTETEKDFLTTIKALEEIQFDFAYMFKYSERPFTSAANIEPKVEESVKTERLKTIIKLQNSITNRKLETEIGKTYMVFTEKSLDSSIGRSENNRQVFFEGKVEDGNIYKVKVVKKEGWKLFGEVINE